MRELIPNDELREAVLDSGVSLYLIAKRLGHLRPNGGVDTKRVRQALGITANYTTSKGRKYVTKQQRLNTELAYQIAMSAGLDPYEAGL